MSRLSVLLVAGFVLAGCGEKVSVVPMAEAFHISSVETVGPPPAGGNQAQLDDLRKQTMAMAARVPRTKNPYLLRLRILSFHKKNPGMAIVLGDSNNMTVSGEVTSLDGSRKLGTFTSTVSNDGAVNGVVGAVLAANTSTDEAIRALNNDAADQLLEQVYGTKAWRSWKPKNRSFFQ
jgi:hypothetical protein